MTTTLERTTWTVEEPGVVDGMPDHVYHRDPVPGGSLSSSGARKLLPPSCPALFRHEQLNPPAPKKTFELGHAAHQLVLGTGPELVLVDRPRWDTKDVKAEVAEIRAAGAVPLKQDEWDQVHAMAAKLREHPMASALLHRSGGKPEQSLFWRDDETEVWRRARLDWLPNPSTGRMIIPDYKTCVSAAPEHLQKAIHDYRYHCQADYYLDAVKALGLADDDATFAFICQMKTAPYLVTIVELAQSALLIGRDLNRRALRLYRDCLATDRWPSFSEDVELIALPAWAERAHYATEGTPNV